MSVETPYSDRWCPGMSGARIARSAVAAIVVLSFLIAVSSAGAAAWQGPLQISTSAVNVGDTTPHISLGVNGDAGAAWWDEGDGGRFVLARKRAGAAWSAPVSLVSGVSQTPIFVGVDGAGDVTAAYVTTGSAWNVANWAAGSATPTTTPLTLLTPPLNITDLAVNANGDAVLSGLSGSAGANGVVVGYRHGFGGAFALHPYPYPVNGFAASAARVAINASGMAIVAIRSGTTLVAATRTATVDWPPSVGLEQVTLKAVMDTGDPSVTLDAAGNAFAAFTYTIAGPATVLRTALRPPGGGWQESPDLSSATANFTANFVNVVVNPSGTALLVWEESSTTGFGNIQARAGSTGTGIWGPIETVNDAGADVPVAAIGNDGTGVAAWERETLSGNTGQARVRSPGAAGTWGDIHNLSSLHANATHPSLSTDGIGDFATISAPFVDALAFKPAYVSVYDAAPPTVSPPTVTGTLLAGDPVTMTVTATDGWSSVGVPAWTFGDGGTGSALTVNHTYATPGTYTAHVSVTDGSGNTAGRDVSISISSPQATLTSAKFAGKWKVSRVTGTLKVAGVTPRAGSYAINVFKGKTRKIHVVFNLAAGAFTRTLKLPVKFLPGTYNVSLVPGDAQVKGASRTASLAAPASGVVDVAFLSGARNGTAARTLTGASTIWASFHFAAKPKGKLTLTWYRIGKKRVRLGATSKDSAVKVVSYLRNAKPFVGRYQAVLSRKGVVIARASVRAKG